MNDGKTPEEMKHEADLYDRKNKEHQLETERISTKGELKLEAQRIRADVEKTQSDNQRKITIGLLILLGVMASGLMFYGQWGLVTQIVTAAIGLVSGVAIGKGKLDFLTGSKSTTSPSPPSTPPPGKP